MVEADREDLEREMRVREALIHEVHHRVKNNLQTVESLLRMDYRRSTSEEAKRALLEASNRLRSMSFVHEMLSESDQETLDIVLLARNVAEQVKNGFLGATNAFQVEVEGRSRILDGSKAISLALVIAEIVHNSFEHGFEQRDHGCVSIVLEEHGEQLIVTIADDGVGLPQGFSLTESTSMGLTLMKTLVEDDLDGTIEAIDRRDFDGLSGTLFCFTMPLAAIEPTEK